MRHLLFTGCIVLLSVSAASAQQVTVQQPVVSFFGVGTTVVAPDSGGAYVGGVRRAGAATIRSGFFAPVVNTGRFDEGSSVSTHVWIHDFESMEQELLGAARPRPTDVLTENAEHAYRLLRTQSTNMTWNPGPVARESRIAGYAASTTAAKSSTSSNRGAVPKSVAPPAVAATPAIVTEEPPARTTRPLASRRASPLADQYRRKAQHFLAQGKNDLAQSYLRLADQTEARSR